MAINLQIKAGETVPRHHANTDVIVYVASGEVLFGVEENRHHMKEGSLLHLKPFEKHDIEALQDASLLVFKIGSNPVAVYDHKKRTALKPPFFIVRKPH